MLENPRVFVFSPVLFCSEGSSPGSISYVRIFTLFIGTFVVVDEITQVLCIDLIFDVKSSRKFRTCLDDSGCNVRWKIFCQRILKAFHDVLSFFSCIRYFHCERDSIFLFLVSSLSSSEVVSTSSVVFVVSSLLLRWIFSRTLVTKFEGYPFVSMTAFFAWISSWFNDSSVEQTS